MAKQNNLQLYRGQGIPPANSMLEGEIAMDTDRKVLWINSGQAIKPIGIIEGGTTPSADYAGTLWIDNNASPTGIPADFLVANNLTTQAPGAYVLDAYQGKILKDALDAQQLAISDQSDEINGLSDQINNLSEDFIVEQGTSGIWTYRKWNSGIAECWGVVVINSSSWTAWGSLYIYANASATAYPFPFLDPPNLSVYPRIKTSGATSCWAVAYKDQSIENQRIACHPTVIRPTAGDTNTDYYAFVRAIGTWK